MVRKLAIIYRLYLHSLMFLGIVLSVAFVYVIYLARNVEHFSLFLIIFFRIVVFIPVLYFFSEFKKKEFMYYRNLGITKLQSLSYIYIIDSIIAIVILTISYVIFR